MYGNSNDARYRATLLQCGKLYRRQDGAEALFEGFSNSSIGFDLRFHLTMLQKCMEAGSNEPYWAQNDRMVNSDLRNPRFRKELNGVCKQFDLSLSQLIK